MNRFAPLSAEELSASEGLYERLASAAPNEDSDALVSPIPDDAPPAPKTHFRFGGPTASWTYRDENNAELFHILRFDPPGKRKEFLPLSLWRKPDGMVTWEWRGVPTPRPLYRLDWLAANSEHPAVVCEGEKSADAAQRVFSDRVCVTSPGGSQAASKADWSPLANRQVLIWPDNDAAGARYAREVAAILIRLGCEVSIIDAMALARMAPGGGAREPEDKWDAANAVAEWRDLAALREAALGLAKPIAADDKVSGPVSAKASGAASDAEEGPRPLRRELSPADPFPIGALGDVLGGAADAIIDKVKCPDALAACSVLAAASLAAQLHADVVIPATGRARPVSLNVLSIAISGERKSEADDNALWAARKREEALRQQYEAEMPDYMRAKRAFAVATASVEKKNKDKDRREIEAALRAIGEEPLPPLSHILMCGEPTLEGLHKLFINGQPGIGLFSDEGGSFIGGHAMSDESRLRTVAGLSSLWDGGRIKRIRGGDGSAVLIGRRLSFHLMAQPDVAAQMLSDPMIRDQGFLSRLLICWPQSTVGTRFQKPLLLGTETALRRYGGHLLDIFEMPPRLVEGERNALEPRRLEFSEPAKGDWLSFADEVEGRLAQGGPLEPVCGFANKLPEHATRIAGVLALIDDPDCNSISKETLERAIKIADFFATEALRLVEAGACSPELRQAEKLLEWLKGSWREPLIGLSVIYQFGPRGIREAETAKRAVGILEEHGWLIREPSGKGPQPKVDGKPVREAWRIVREA